MSHELAYVRSDWLSEAVATLSAFHNDDPDCTDDNCPVTRLVRGGQAFLQQVPALTSQTVIQFGFRLHYPTDRGQVVPVATGALEVLRRRFDPEDATLYQRTVTYGPWEPVPTGVSL